MEIALHLLGETQIISALGSCHVYSSKGGNVFHAFTPGFFEK